MNYDLFFTIIAIYFVINGVISYTFPWWYSKTRLQFKGRNFILNRLFGTTTDNTWKIFWCSVLWLVVYYFNNIKLLIGMQ